MRTIVSLALVLAALGAAVPALADSPAGIADVKVEIKNNPLLKDKESKEKDPKPAPRDYLKVSFTVTPSAPIDAKLTVRLKATCKVGAETKVSDVPVLGGKFDALAAGTKSRVVFASPFITEGLPVTGKDNVTVKPSSCVLSFALGKVLPKEPPVPLGDFCWNGTDVAPGPCK